MRKGGGDTAEDYVTTTTCNSRPTPTSTIEGGSFTKQTHTVVGLVKGVRSNENAVL